MAAQEPPLDGGLCQLLQGGISRGIIYGGNKQAVI